MIIFDFQKLLLRIKPVTINLKNNIYLSNKCHTESDANLEFIFFNFYQHIHPDAFIREWYTHEL